MPLRRFIVASLLTALLSGCVVTPTVTPDPITSVETVIPLDTSSPFVVYFTTPEQDLSVENVEGVERYLVEAIDATKTSLDIAIYNFTLKSVSDAAIRAHQRGVTVRIVMESDNMDSNSVQRMVNAGIPIVGDFQPGSMHNKFVVIDGYEVWTGSANLSAGAFYTDNNNLLRIRSTQLAENFTVEFEEMFYDNLFGPNTKAATPDPEVKVDGRLVETYFSPDDKAANHLITLIQTASTRIDFMAFSLTSDSIASALVARLNAGVEVRGVMDASQVESNTGGEFANLRQDGVNVRLSQGDGLMHHKVMIIDGRYVVTGSYNFTGNAERSNDENLLIIDDPALAAQYEAEFEKVFASARQP